MVYKLTYFDARGRAEPIRIILSAANVNFEDNRISKESYWPSLKKCELMSISILYFVNQSKL